MVLTPGATYNFGVFPPGNGMVTVISTRTIEKSATGQRVDLPFVV